MSLILRTEKLTKRYGKVLAVDELSLCVHAGECFGFVGLNGAGKSTTINMIANVIEPTTGSFRTYGADTGDERPCATMGVVFGTNAAAEPTWSTYRYLRHFGTLEGLSRGEIRTRSANLLRRLSLASDAHRPMSQLSTGNLRKVELARALLSQPDLLLLDEPTRELDITAKEAYWQILESLRASGVAIFLASHDVTEIARLCDRIGVVNQGRLVWEGKTGELSRNPAILVRLLLDMMAVPARGQIPEAAAEDQRDKSAPTPQEDRGV